MLSISFPLQAKTLSDGDIVTLTGTIKMKTGYGPPNYGEDPKNDKKFQYPELTVKTPFDFKAGEFGSDAKGVKRMQVLWSSHNKQQLPTKGCVVITGELMGWETASHKTPVLIDGKSVKPCQ